MKSDSIRFVGVHDLNSISQKSIHKLALEYLTKFKRAVNTLVEVVVHVKLYHQEGKRKKYSIHVKVSSPSHTFTSTKASDWDLSRTMHKACKDCLSQIEHRLKTSEQKPRMVRKKIGTIKAAFGKRKTAKRK